MAEKEHWWREESITACPKEEDPISEDSKKTSSLRTLKRTYSMRNLKRTLTVNSKDNAINRDPQELQDPHSLWRLKLTLFGFLVMVYNRVDDGDKFPKKKFGLGRLLFSCYQSLKCLTRSGPGIINCFCLHGIFTGYVSAISNKCGQCIL